MNIRTIFFAFASIVINFSAVHVWCSQEDDKKQHREFLAWHAENMRKLEVTRPKASLTLSSSSSFWGTVYQFSNGYLSAVRVPITVGQSCELNGSKSLVNTCPNKSNNTSTILSLQARENIEQEDTQQDQLKKTLACLLNPKRLPKALPESSQYPIIVIDENENLSTSSCQNSNHAQTTLSPFLTLTSTKTKSLPLRVAVSHGMMIGLDHKTSFQRVSLDDEKPFFKSPDVA